MRYKLKVFFTLMLASGSSWAANTETCVKTDRHQIEALFDKWNNSLQSGDPKIVTNNYLTDAVLLPTMSNRVRLSQTERIEYFVKFLKNKPVGKIDSRTVKIYCDSAIDIGTYTFTFADGTRVSSRYTFTYGWTGKEWKISTHHSSAMPE